MQTQNLLVGVMGRDVEAAHSWLRVWEGGGATIHHTCEKYGVAVSLEAVRSS